MRQLPRFLQIFPWIGPLVALLATGCGYHFQSSKGSTLERQGIRKVYIAPLRNDSYKVGVENLIYNELLQSVLAGKRVRIVSRPELADAILQGTIRKAEYTASATTDSNSLYPSKPSDKKVITMVVATEYVASVNCIFKLAKRGDSSKVLWESSFDRSKRFPASNQKDVFGNTAPLINESEFDRALRDVARDMMQDVHESMLAMF